ncbi:MAG: HAD family hydrolase [Chitinispirillaceae bacterium]
MPSENNRFPEAILFDLDDTIIAYGSISKPIWKEICSGYSRILGIEETTLFNAVLKTSRFYWSDPQRHRFGRNNQMLARRKIVQDALKTCGIKSDMYVNTIADTFLARRQKAIHLFPGSIETLEFFRGKGVKLGLITNGEAHVQREKISRFCLEKYFDGIFIEGELGYGKPDERIYSLALGSLRTKAEECWIVGDNLEWEVQIPLKLGFYTVWNDVRGKGLPEHCDFRPHRTVCCIRELMD